MVRMLIHRQVSPGVSSLPNLAVVSYFYPGPAWDPIVAAEPGIATIINPNSGVGMSLDPNYLAQTQAVQAAGGTVWGYVYTTFAARAIGVVEAEILKYFQWYGVNGIFCDETSTNPADVAYYIALRTYAQGAAATYSRTSRFVINPGTQTDVAYGAGTAADLICNFEGSASDYFTLYSAPGWVATKPASLFYHIIHDASALQLAPVVLLAAARNAGTVYVTDGVEPNPYGALPSYWAAESVL